MKHGTGISRRGLLKAGAAGGLGVCVAPLFSPAYAALFESKLLTPIAWNGVDGSVKFRIDGTAKVAGEKIFAYDIRSRDMPHWPQKQAHALLLRTTFADRPFTGIDISGLGDDLKPDRVVTAEDLVRDKVGRASCRERV